MRRIVALALVAVACSAPGPIASATASGAPTIPAATPAPATVPAPIVPAAPVHPAPTPPVTPPLDARTAALIEDLDGSCATRPTPVIPLGVIGQLASGRSARETVEVLARSKCLLRPAAYGEGASEVVTVGAYLETGAVLWVDRGFWKIAPVPIDYGYLALLWDMQRGVQRELFFEIWSGGSAGARGYVAIGISGESARMTLHTAPGASQMFARRLDADHVLVTGRKLPERRWGIDSNCCLPGGHEWLWGWTPAGYVLGGERQSRDAYYALSALLGAIDSGHPETASDVATPSAIDAAAVLFGPGLLWTYKASANANEQDQAELLRWNVLPGAAPIAAAAVRYEVARYQPAGPTAVITFERIGDGWLATDVHAGALP